MNTDNASVDKFANPEGVAPMQALTQTYLVPLLIDGQDITGGGRDSRAIVNPATGQTVGEVTMATATDIDRAAEIAQAGFEDWRRRSAHERGNILGAAASSMRANAEGLARLLTTEQGKTLKEAHGEVGIGADLVQWLGEEGKRLYGRIVPSRSAATEQLVLLEPVGPVAAFAAWNYPVALASRKIAHALAAGCSVVLKPAEECPSAVLALARIFHAAGVPPAALQVLYGRPAEVSERLIASPHIRKITFTGSTAVGRELAALAARALKKVTFELGGHAPVIVMDDANLDAFVQAAVSSKYRNAGQICTSPSRFFVHERVYQRVVRAFVQRASQLVVGDGSEAGSDMGPLAHSRRVAAIEALTEDALTHGGRLLTGGPGRKNGGFFWQPTVLADVPDSARVMREEPFGPIAPFQPFASLDEALRAANSTGYGLAGYAFTSTIDSARRIQEGLSVGTIGLNTFAATSADMPFGGINDSGIGAAQGQEGLMEYMNVKSVFRAGAQ